MTKGIGNLMRQAQQLHSKMLQVQEEMAAKTAEASQRGMVTAVANGRQRWSPSRLKRSRQPGDVECSRI